MLSLYYNYDLFFSLLLLLPSLLPLSQNNWTINVVEAVTLKETYDNYYYHQPKLFNTTIATTTAATTVSLKKIEQFFDRQPFKPLPKEDDDEKSLGDEEPLTLQSSSASDIINKLLLSPTTKIPLLPKQQHPLPSTTLSKPPPASKQQPTQPKLPQPPSPQTSNEEKVENVHHQKQTNIDVKIFEGTYFQEMGKVVFTSTGHYSVLVFDSSVLSNTLLKVQELIQSIQSFSNEKLSNKIKYFYYKINKLASTIARINFFFDSFLIRFGNKFGIDETFKLVSKEHVTYVVNEIQQNIIKRPFINNTLNNITFINQEISYMHIDQTMLGKLNESVELVEWVCDKIKEQFSDNQTKTFENVDSDLVLTQAVNFIYFSTQTIEMFIDRIIIEIENMIKGQVSSFLLPPDIFQKQILEVLQDMSSLPYPASSTFLSIYYSISRVIVRKIGSKFYFIIRIPLQTVDEKYNLYKAHSFWFYPNSNKQNEDAINNGDLVLARKIRLDDGPFLAVKTDLQYFVNIQDLTHCEETNNFITVCIPTSEYMQANTNSCLVSLYRQNMNTAYNCPYEFLNDFPISFIKLSSYGWLSSSRKKFKMNEICPQKDSHGDEVFHTKQIIDIPSGISSIIPHSGCFFTGENFILPAFDNNNDNNQYKISINITNINKHDEHSQKIRNIFTTFGYNFFNTYLSQFEINYVHEITNKIYFYFYLIIATITLVCIFFLSFLIFLSIYYYEKKKNGIEKDNEEEEEGLYEIPNNNNNNKNNRKKLLHFPPLIIPPNPLPPPPLLPLSSSSSTISSSLLSTPSSPIPPPNQPNSMQYQEKTLIPSSSLILSTTSPPPPLPLEIPPPLPREHLQHQYQQSSSPLLVPMTLSGSPPSSPVVEVSTTTKAAATMAQLPLPVVVATTRKVAVAPLSEQQQQKLPVPPSPHTRLQKPLTHPRANFISKAIINNNIQQLPQTPQQYSLSFNSNNNNDDDEYINMNKQKSNNI